MYLVSALLLRVTSGYPFPPLSVAAWIAALNVIYLTITWWSTRGGVVMGVARMVTAINWLVRAINRLTAEEIPDNYDWPPPSVADAVRHPAHRLRRDRRNCPGIVRCGGHQGGSATPRRRAGGQTSKGGIVQIPEMARRPVPGVSHFVRDAGAKKGWLQTQEVSRSQDPELVGRLRLQLHSNRTMAFDIGLQEKIEALTPDRILTALRRHLDVTQLSFVKAGDFKKAGGK
jgi:hypothetical protein